MQRYNCFKSCSSFTAYTRVPYQPIYLTSGSSSAVVIQNCSTDTFSLSTCNYTLVNASCTPAALQCQRRQCQTYFLNLKKSENFYLSLACSIYDARLVNSITSYPPSGGSTTTGILEICTGSFSAVCNTTSERAIALACQRIGFSSECSVESWCNHPNYCA